MLVRLAIKKRLAIFYVNKYAMSCYYLHGLGIDLRTFYVQFNAGESNVDVWSIVPTSDSLK